MIENLRAAELAQKSGLVTRNVIDLRDITSHTYGIETARGRMTPLISKGAVLPCKYKKLFTTTTDN